MKVSIVIPAYNEEVLLGRCLDSIERALVRTDLTKDDYELIVVNNASTDRTREIALSRGARVVDEPRKGVTRARNAGFRAARGDIIVHPDADTHVPDEWLSIILDEFARSPRLVALTGPFRYDDLPPVRRFLTDVYNGAAYVMHHLNHYPFRVGAVIQGGNYAVRRDALEKIGGYNVNIEFYGEDTDTARRLAKIGDIKWTWRLYTYSSGRRLAVEGVFMTGVRYGLNYLSTTYWRGPVTQHYRDIRPKPGELTLR